MPLTSKIIRVLVCLLILFTLLLVTSGGLLLKDAIYFNTNKAAQFSEIAKNYREDPEKRFELVMTAAQTRSLATNHAAIAAACFAFCCLGVAWTSFVVSQLQRYEDRRQGKENPGDFRRGC